MQRQLLPVVILFLLWSLASLPPRTESVAPQLLATRLYACALDPSGHVDCWGTVWGQQISNGFAALVPHTTFASIDSDLWKTCGVVASNNSVLCWGDLYFTPPLPASFDDVPARVVAAGTTTCVLLTNGQPLCYARADASWNINPPEGVLFEEIAAISQSACGRQSNGTVVCWGSNGYGETDVPADLVFAKIVGISAAWRFCGVLQNGSLACWGNNRWQMAPPADGPYILNSLVVNPGDSNDVCALRNDLSAACWGLSYDPRYAPTTIPTVAAGQFKQVTVGDNFACGLLVNGTVLCWGDNSAGQLNPPADTSFELIAAGRQYVCGMRSDYITVCWGSNLFHATESPCPLACFGGGAPNSACSACTCPGNAEPATCTCNNTCAQGGRVTGGADCSCTCYNTCKNGGSLGDDCTCECPADGCTNGGQPQADCTCECPADGCANGGQPLANCTCECLADGCANGGQQQDNCSCICSNTCENGGSLGDDCTCECLADGCANGGQALDNCTCECPVNGCTNGGKARADCTCECPVKGCTNGGIARADCTCECPVKGCTNGGQARADCTCECPVKGCTNGGQARADCTCECPINGCINGAQARADCTCECLGCPIGGVLNSTDCSCMLPLATEPVPAAGAAPNSSSEASNVASYKIAGGYATYSVQVAVNWTGEITDAGPGTYNLIYLDLLNSAARWSGASCGNSGNLFVGANMANLDINLRYFTVVRLSGDSDGGWLYVIVKCVTATNTLVLAPYVNSWWLDATHCPDNDCSLCLPLGRSVDNSDPAYYLSHCTAGPAPMQSGTITLVVFSGWGSGYQVEPAPGSNSWTLVLPQGRTCVRDFQNLAGLFSSIRNGIMNNRSVEIVMLTGDGGLRWEYINLGCALTQTSGGVSYSTLNLRPYNWNPTPVHCPYLDCSACLPTSPTGSCSPSNLAATQLTLLLLDATSLNVSWSYVGPPVWNYRIYAGYLSSLPTRSNSTTNATTVSLGT